jgi:hypothetical protein
MALDVGAALRGSGGPGAEPLPAEGGGRGAAPGDVAPPAGPGRGAVGGWARCERTESGGDGPLVEELKQVQLEKKCFKPTCGWGRGMGELVILAWSSKDYIFRT